MRVCLLAAVAACASSVAAAAGCDPLDPSLCIFPYPNDFWLVNGKTQFSNTTWPEDSSGKQIDPNDGWNGVDGFSPSQPTLCYMPNVSLSADLALPRVWDIAQSLSATAHSALIDASTGERVAHWLETDHSSDDWDDEFKEDDMRALMGWPAQRLKGSTRYIFAVSHLVNTDGQVIAPSTAFKALRDKLPYAPIEQRRQHFEQDIFPLLTAAGMSRADLSIAWDFTTASDDTWTSDMVSMRDQTLALQPQGAEFAVQTRNHNPRPGVAVELEGLITVPWFLSDTESVAGTHVVHGADGKPEQQGSNEVDFYMVVPESVANGSMAATAVYYGHGLFGSANELNNGYLDDEANRNGWVLVGVNWLGLCDKDVAADGIMVADDLSLFPFIQARLHQAQANALLAHRSLWTSMTADPALQVAGKPVLDADSPKHYYGNSLGGIMGSVFMSLTTDVTRGVLGVPGGPFSLLLPRSKDFAALFDIIRLRYDKSMDRIAMMALIQEQFTYLEPGGYVNHISADPFPNTPKHTVILHYGQGDAQVNWLGAEWLGRSIGGAQAYESTMRVRNCTLFGFDTIPDTATPAGDSTSLIQGYYFGVPDANIPLVNVPCASETDTHSKTRQTAHAEEQTHLFLDKNQIVNTCGGQCHETP